jgi:hypothetical protein
VGPLAVLFLAIAAQAQTVSPVIMEYREKAKGQFQISNDSVVPLNVSLEPRSFSVDGEGHPTFRKLDAEVHVRLSTTSFRLGPKQAFTIFYDASAARPPVWFTIYATITGPPNPSGLQLALELPHTVYLLTKKPLVREEVVVGRAEFRNGEGAHIEAEIESHGKDFGRVQSVEVLSEAGKKDYAGFPLFPGQRRALSLEWDQPGTPQRMVLKFEKFQVEHSIAPAPAKPTAENSSSRNVSNGAPLPSSRKSP